MFSFPDIMFNKSSSSITIVHAGLTALISNFQIYTYGLGVFKIFK